jgi:hypothetical protein
MVQDAPHNEPSTPTLQAQSKPPESWYDKFTHRPSTKGREKESKETDSWLQAREVSSVYCVLCRCPIVFPFLLDGDVNKRFKICSFSFSQHSQDDGLIYIIPNRTYP